VAAASEDVIDGIRATIAHLAIPITSVRPHPLNPNAGDVDAIVESLRSHGHYVPIVFNARQGGQSQGCIIKGNHTSMAMLQMERQTIAAAAADVDDEQAIKIMLADNRLSDLHRTDGGLLLELLQTLPSIDGTGYDAQALDDLLARVEAAQEMPLGSGLEGDPDAVPAVPQGEPLSRPGDLIVLGRHRLLVGDSTVLADVERLMDGAQAAMVWTDPPYGVAYEGVWHGEDKKRTAIKNDALDGDHLEQFLRDALTNAWTVCRAGGVWYVAAPPGPPHHIFGTVLLELDVWRQTLNWVKSSFVLGRSDYHDRHEPIFYGWKEGASHYFVDDRTQDTLWEIARPPKSDEHPTMKPVELIARAIRNSSHAGDIIYDGFGGSGTTFVAAHIEGRAARLLEIDPCYADVICKRFQGLTGVRPVLEATGDAYDFMAGTPRVRHGYATGTPRVRHGYATGTPRVRHGYATGTPRVRHG